MAPPRYRRRNSLRLEGYDYSRSGAYFVTFCTEGRRCLFGAVIEGRMQRNLYGRIVQACWNALPSHYPHVVLDAFVVMPDHVHALIGLADTNVEAGFKPAPTAKRHGLPEIVRALKTFSARKINEKRQTPGVRIWQRGYYEHTVRSDRALQRIRRYIAENPLRWHLGPVRSGSRR